MKDLTKNIVEALNEIGVEKIQAAGSIENVIQQLQAYGVEASPAEVQAVLQEIVKMADTKQELDVETMENVAGGIAPAALIPLIPTVIDGITTVVKKIKGDPKKPEKQTGAPTTTTAPTTAPQGPSVTQNFTENQKFSNQVNVNGSNNVGDLDFTA